MRLWHHQLIPYLPQKMLVSQWRELIAIKRQWEKETLIHPLVSYVKEYNKAYFSNYTHKVYLEMKNRNIRCKDIYTQEILDFANVKIINENLLFKEHDNEYLTICYFNLKEKYLRGIISLKEWQLLDDYYIKNKR